MYTTLPKLIAAGHFMVDKICLIFPETGICSLCNKKKKKTLSHMAGWTGLKSQRYTSNNYITFACKTNPV